MNELIKKLSRAARRREGCHLTAAMVRELVEMRTIRRFVEEERRPPKPRALPVTVTTRMVREIRALKAENPRMTNCRIAEAIGCSTATVQRYATEHNERQAKIRDAERYAKDRQNMERVQAKRVAALAQYHRKKAERESRCPQQNPS